MSDWDTPDELEETELPPEGTAGEEDELAEDLDEEIPEGFSEVEDEPTF